MLCVHGTGNSADRGFIGRILSPRIPLHHQRPNLDVQLLDIGLADFCALLRFRPAGEHRLQPFRGTPLPLAHHRLVDAVLGRQLRRR